MTMAFDPVFTPRVQRQLVKRWPTGKNDCGVRTNDWLISFASGGLIRIADPNVIRSWQGNATGPTGITQVKAGFEGAANLAGSLGLDWPDMQIRAGTGLVRPVGQLRDALQAGKGVALFVEYGVINDDPDFDDLSGQPSLRGIHIVPVQGLRRGHRGRLWVTSFDPLYDGRVSSGVRVPNGPCELPFGLIARMAAGYQGAGTAVFGAVGRATVLEPPPVVDPTTEALAKAEQERDRAQAALGVITQLGTDINWPRLTELAMYGLPAPSDETDDSADGAAPLPEDD